MADKSMKTAISTARPYANPGRLDRIFPYACAVWLVMTGLYSLRDLIANTLPFSFVNLFTPILFLVWVTLPLWAVFFAIRELRVRAYIPALLAGFIPLFAVGSILYGVYIGDVIRVEMNRQNYMSQIEAARAGNTSKDLEIDIGPPTVAFFIWGGFTSSSYGAIYDETDGVAQSVSQRLSIWHDRPVPGELKCPGDVVPLGGHFYVGHFSC